MKNKISFAGFSIATLVLWPGIFALAPFLLVFVVSFLERDESRFVALNFSWDNYRLLFDPLYFKVFLNSFSISLISTTLCLIFGYPFALILTKIRPAWRYIALGLVVIPFWTNSLVRTYGIRILIGHNGLINQALLSLGLINEPLELLYTHFAVILGTVYIFFPFMILPLYSVLEKLDPVLVEAAGDLGASRLKIFLKVTLPLSLPGIIAGCLLVFLPSLGVFYVSDLLGGSKILLLGNVVRGQFLEARDWPFGSAVSLGLYLLMSLLALAYLAARRYAHTSPSQKESLL